MGRWALLFAWLFHRNGTTSYEKDKKLKIVPLVGGVVVGEVIVGPGGGAVTERLGTVGGA